jgi:hypothetical protein
MRWKKRAENHINIPRSYEIPADGWKKKSQALRWTSSIHYPAILM